MYKYKSKKKGGVIRVKYFGLRCINIKGGVIRIKYFGLRCINIKVKKKEE